MNFLNGPPAIAGRTSKEDYFTLSKVTLATFATHIYMYIRPPAKTIVGLINGAGQSEFLIMKVLLEARVFVAPASALSKVCESYLLHSSSLRARPARCSVFGRCD
ncbi:hypothetical protein EVAR_10584_1 [Eumeta japonica]|uniref:Uncharacterized protein n=1 Tax=Eumeta variegata TaxID=151549 RepID=A0A4C1U1Y1_EUMVA|nr:hypothetical protein EVAR_10584_1 [Eumeta japonica]